MRADVIEVGEYKGYSYLVKKIIPEWEPQPLLNDCWYCGYVVVPKTHPFYKKDYDDIYDEIEVHGGLTYSRMVTREFDFGLTGEDDEWVIGFDCNHFSDNPRIQDALYVKGECMELIEQLIKINEVGHVR